MVRITLSEEGKREETRLQFHVEDTFLNILSYVPKADLIGIDHIYVTNLPEQYKKLSQNASGAYFQKHRNRPAYIEIYLKNLFSHIKGPESLSLMLPIQCVEIAQTLFHEVGHHLEHTRSHGVRKPGKERFADTYAKKLVNTYTIKNADTINSCFDNLESIAETKGLSTETIQQMRAGWDQHYDKALGRL